ncbi:DUF3025 domain-containing protein [Solilutibacter tolerans]|uniref:DUF3025 domain-containing protein n=1 Tax=Solilutibacter tolerans TaxID=1604334 RepID=A0A1N6VSX8_9GAMM|nr:DUF3025 domain-containing protein [Lysobacter tolerans]SIQ80736.1 Protein of unknown function [Lysobacter tolerans]
MAVKRRFIAPSRSEVDSSCFAHPLYAQYADYIDWMQATAWPCIEDLNRKMSLDAHRFVLQDQALLADGLHYEVRIGEKGRIATRAENWHDLFNAMVWCRWPALKLAFNALQRSHIAKMGPSNRNRAQYALTQFDEAGVIVRMRDPSLLSLWDAHDWTALFHAHADAWASGDIAIAAVVGHALLEHGLQPAQYIVGKALVVQGDVDDATCVARIADGIAAGELLNDPLELRPLPLAGVPGWHVGQDAAFFREAACFQPLREGRVYPEPSLVTLIRDSARPR